MVGTIIASQDVVTNLCWHELPQFIQNLFSSPPYPH